MSFHIAAARRADVPIVLSLIRELAEYEKLLHIVEGTEDALAAELFGDHSLIECVVAWQSTTAQPQAIGFALFFHNFSTFLARRGLYLEDLYVQPQARGQGVGRALLKHLAQLAVQRGCGRFEWSVLDWNQSAIDFYQALGAQVLPDWRICRVTGDALHQLAGRELRAP